MRMRRFAMAAIACWIALAWGFRVHDRRPHGPPNRPAILYDLVPLRSFDLQPLMDAIQPARARAAHPLLVALGLLAFLPLALAGRAAARAARRAAARPRREDELPGETARRLR